MSCSSGLRHGEVGDAHGLRLVNVVGRHRANGANVPRDGAMTRAASAEVRLQETDGARQRRALTDVLGTVEPWRCAWT